MHQLHLGISTLYIRELRFNYYFSNHIKYILSKKIINSDFLFKINLIYKTTDICSIFNADLSFSRNNFFFKLSKHNIYLTVKFTNKIHPSPLFFLFKSMINNIPESNKWINITSISFTFIFLPCWVSVF